MHQAAVLNLAILADQPAVQKLQLAIHAMQLQAAALKSLLAILVQLQAATPVAESRSVVCSRRSSHARNLLAAMILVQPLATQLQLVAAPADRHLLPLQLLHLPLLQLLIHTLT
jgi:hypothetical protein